MRAAGRWTGVFEKDSTMETVTRFAERPQTGSPSPISMPSPDVARALSVKATYLLSEDGRKASLLSGGDGRAVQQIALQVPSNRLHLVSVDKQGVALLKLRPRFERDDDRGLIRIDAAPVYDAPPTVDELYRAAAQNHELEAEYYAQRSAERGKRTGDDRAQRERAAEAFLADKGLRAVVHPPPSPKRCYVIADGKRLIFDVATDQGIARDVPPEAHRRFRADLRARQERNKQDRAAQLALHEEKKQFIAEWVAANGTDEQRVRQQAGMLPMVEAVDGITDQVFAICDGLPLYTRDGSSRLQQFVREMGFFDAVVAPSDVEVRSRHAVKATAEQWAIVQKLMNLLHDANVVLREHVLSSKARREFPSLSVFGVLVTKRYGPFVLRREYVVDSGTQS
jgi:hypothetical protein